MDQSELLRFVVETFRGLQVRHFVTGSIASGIYGEPRFTNDIDVVADLREEHVGPLLHGRRAR